MAADGRRAGVGFYHRGWRKASRTCRVEENSSHFLVRCNDEQGIANSKSIMCLVFWYQDGLQCSGPRDSTWQMTPPAICSESIIMMYASSGLSYSNEGDIGALQSLASCGKRNPFRRFNGGIIIPCPSSCFWRCTNSGCTLFSVHQRV